ncbi:MAG: molybdate ABC transporter substrate-binding protein [Pseudomonadota bacterium]
MAGVRPLWAAAPVRVFAAASLKLPLDAIASTWDGPPISLAYGGSGTLARQVARGAPADLVVLAATDWMEWLQGQGRIEGSTVSVAGNRLALVGPPDAARFDLSRAAVLDRLGPNGRFAMGDPMSAPVGRYGQQALETLGLWADLRDRAILVENVRAALAYVARGDVKLGLVYASDTVGSDVTRVADIPVGAHQPIRYPAGLVPGAPVSARRFLDLLRQAGDMFAAHGFAPAQDL